MFWFFLIALWAAMLLSPLLLLFMFLPSGRDCPRCANETLPLVSRLLRPVRRLTQLRWCASCGWQGVMRRARVGSPLPKFEVVPDDGGEEDGDTPWKGGTASY
jgi:hypothetical protein